MAIFMPKNQNKKMPECPYIVRYVAACLRAVAALRRFILRKKGGRFWPKKKNNSLSEEWVFCFTGYGHCFANLVKLLQQSC